MSYRIVKIQGRDFLSGKVNQIMRSITDASDQSLLAAYKRQNFQNLHQAEVLIVNTDEHSVTDQEFYINDIAYEILTSKNVAIGVDRVADAPPEGFGILVSVPIYS
jgi:hypothetical protein